MEDLRKQAELDLADTLEGEFGQLITLYNPIDGGQQTVRGQVLNDRTWINPETGEPIVVVDPVVVVRRSSLDRVPTAGENWVVTIPIDPTDDGETKDYLVRDLAYQGGRSIGFIRLYLTAVSQSS